MGFDRKMDSKVDSKPAWEASPPPFSFYLSTLLSIPRQIQHITLDIHPVERGARLGGAESALTKRSWSPVCSCLSHLPGSIIPKNSVAISCAPPEITIPTTPRELGL